MSKIRRYSSDAVGNELHPRHFIIRGEKRSIERLCGIAGTGAPAFSDDDKPSSNAQKIWGSFAYNLVLRGQFIGMYKNAQRQASPDKGIILRIVNIIGVITVVTGHYKPSRVARRNTQVIT